MTVPAFAKRVAPKIAPPIVAEGVEYRPIHDRYQEKGKPRGIRTHIEARDVKTRKSLWRVEVYHIRYRLDLETDVQDVFINQLKLDANGLLAVNERGQRFRLEPKTGAVKIHAPRQLDLRSILGKRYRSTGMQLLKRADHASTSIKDAKSLSAVFTNAKDRAAIAKHVDFKREQLVLMAWRGSSSRRTAARVEKNGNERTVIFYDPQPRGPRSADDNWNTFAFVIDANAKWSIGTTKPGKTQEKP
jgi:hypothetical protein